MALFKQAEGRIRRISSKYDKVHSVVLSDSNYWDRRVHQIVEQKKNLSEWICNDKTEDLLYFKEINNLREL